MNVAAPASNQHPQQRHRRRLAVAALVPLAVLLASCGGGGSGFDNGGIFVNTMNATAVSYGRNMSVSLAGTGLDKGVRVTVDSGCGEVTETAGGDAFTRRFTCRVKALGPLTIRAYNNGSLELARLQVSVPEPEVTMILQGLDATPSTFTVKLDPVQAPISVNNFLDYVNGGFYRSTIFHRVVKDFVVQAGGYTASTTGATLKTGTSPAIALESRTLLRNVKGTIAMARTAVPDSATSQFYINTVDNPSLDYKSESDPGYAVFGAVISGMDVIERLNAVPVRVDLLSGLTHLPVTNVTILAATQSK
jgi:cyclophilin family peptidyl-prolyl cis-trans isomerase